MSMNTLKITIASSPAEAPHYKGTNMKGAELSEAVIVLNGTMRGNATVDFIFEVKSPSGETESVCVAMITGALIKSLATTIGAAEQQIAQPKT